MYFRTSAFQVLKFLPQIATPVRYCSSRKLFCTFMKSLKFVNLRFKFYVFNRTDFQSAKPKL